MAKKKSSTAVPTIASAPPDPNYPSISITGSVISMRPDVAASLMGVTICFIEEQMRDGKLPFVRLGKRKIIFYSDLVAWAQKERAQQLSKAAIDGLNDLKALITPDSR